MDSSSRSIVARVCASALYLFVLVITLVPQTGFSHESQPGVVEIEELGPSRFQITWKAPIYYSQPHPAKLILPDDWQKIGDTTQRRRTNDIVHTIMVSTQAESIDGRVIRFPGLETTITDVFIRVKRADGSQMTTVARPTKTWVKLRDKKVWYVLASEYVSLGFHHIIMGIDHLLFVLGLLIIVQGRMMLIKTITSFTIAHSITLALATLGIASVPRPPLNAAIALSILFLGPEIVRVWRGESSLTIRHPWVVAFAFGLLHGFGFASGLSITGMIRSELAPALLFFNIGVELGQLGFVGLILAVWYSLIRVGFQWPKWANMIPGYTVGSLGAYWTIQRVAMMITG